jgi:hypothetical protein
MSANVGTFESRSAAHRRRRAHRFRPRIHCSRNYLELGRLDRSGADPHGDIQHLSRLQPLRLVHS